MAAALDKETAPQPSFSFSSSNSSCSKVPTQKLCNNVWAEVEWHAPKKASVASQPAQRMRRSAPQGATVLCL